MEGWRQRVKASVRERTFQGEEGVRAKVERYGGPGVHLARVGDHISNAQQEVTCVAYGEWREKREEGRGHYGSISFPFPIFFKCLLQYNRHTNKQQSFQNAQFDKF